MKTGHINTTNIKIEGKSFTKVAAKSRSGKKANFSNYPPVPTEASSVKMNPSDGMVRYNYDHSVRKFIGLTDIGNNYIDYILSPISTTPLATYCGSSTSVANIDDSEDDTILVALHAYKVNSTTTEYNLIVTTGSSYCRTSGQYTIKITNLPSSASLYVKTYNASVTKSGTILSGTMKWTSGNQCGFAIKGLTQQQFENINIAVSSPSRTLQWKYRNIDDAINYIKWNTTASTAGQPNITMTYRALSGRLEVYADGLWSPLVTIHDIDRTAQDYNPDSSQNVTIMALTKILKKYFMAAIGNIDIMQAAGSMHSFATEDYFFRAGSQTVGPPIYIKNINTSIGAFSTTVTGPDYPMKLVGTSTQYDAPPRIYDFPYTNDDLSFSGASAYLLVGDGMLDEIQITNGGSGYVSPPTVSIVGGGGSGASAETIINSSGNIIKINILNRGKNYTSAPTIEFIGPATVPATAKAILGDGKVLEVLMIKNGAGYDVAQGEPRLQLSGPGRGATFKVITNGTGVQQVDVLTKGSGYVPYTSKISFLPSKSNYLVFGVNMSGSYGVQFKGSFTFDCFDALGIGASGKSDYSISLFNALTRYTDVFAPEYGGNYTGQRMKYVLDMIPLWNLNSANQESQSNYGRYTCNLYLQGVASYHSVAIGSTWYVSGTKFRNF